MAETSYQPQAVINSFARIREVVDEYGNTAQRLNLYRKAAGTVRDWALKIRTEESIYRDTFVVALGYRSSAVLGNRSGGGFQTRTMLETGLGQSFAPFWAVLGRLDDALGELGRVLMIDDDEEVSTKID